MTTRLHLFFPAALLTACSGSDADCQGTWVLGDATALDCPDASDTAADNGTDTGSDSDSDSDGPSGKQVVETGGSYAEVDANYALVPDTLVAQEVGTVAGVGYIDAFDGTIEFDPSTSGWNGNDVDVYAFTVPEALIVTLTGAWPDTASDIDFGIFGEYGDYGIIDWFSSFGDSYCLTGANPEACTTEVPLEADTRYYLVALGYIGTDEEPYHVTLEWTAP